MKRQPTEHDKISASKATEKRLTSKIYRQLNTKKKKKNFKKILKNLSISTSRNLVFTKCQEVCLDMDTKTISLTPQENPSFLKHFPFSDS